MMQMFHQQDGRDKQNPSSHQQQNLWFMYVLVSEWE